MSFRDKTKPPGEPVRNKRGGKKVKRPAGTGPKRTDIERERDLALTARYYLQGAYQYEIPAMLQDATKADYILSREQIRLDLLEIQKRWREESLIDFNEAKAKELDKINEVEREAWVAWRESKRAREQTQTERTELEISGQKKTGTDDKAPAKADKVVIPFRNKVAVKRENQTGEAEYLRVIQWCINKRCEILGLDAPKKIAPTDPEGTSPYEISPTLDMTERARRIVGLLEVAKRRKEQGARPSD